MMRRSTLCSAVVLAATFLASGSVCAQTTQLDDATTAWIQQSTDRVESKVTNWRRDIHEHPELGRFEVRTGNLVAEHLRGLGIEVVTGVAKTGVIGILKGGLPGPVVALRADMDALPLKEDTGLPFASKAKGIYFGKEVDVMHACGHDAHTAMLMGAAEVLAKNKDKIAGTVIFIFQPAEEGAADLDDFESHERYGARRIVEDGILEKYGVESVFGIHIMPRYPAGQYVYRPGSVMSSIDDFRITVTGNGTHGSMPWTGSDAIYSSAQIISGVQSIVSRRVDLTSGFAAVSFGMIAGGTAPNIIPSEVKMSGTMRTASSKIRKVLLNEFPKLVQDVAQTYHTDAKVEIANIYPVTVNNPELTAGIMPMLAQINGGNIHEAGSPSPGSEDFSFYAEKVPGLFIFLGVSNPDNGRDISQEPNVHSPKLMIDERALKSGVMAHVGFVMGYPKVADSVKK